MHILHIYKDYYPVQGGIENHINVLSEGLSARGHRVTVLVTNTSAHDEHIRRGNLHIIKAGRSMHLASTPLSLRMLWHARTLRDVDVVHLHFPYPPGDLAARLVPRCPPLVMTYHSDIVRQRALLKVYRPLLEHTLDRAARIVATSPAYIASSPWLHTRQDRCVTVPYGIDADRFATASTDAAAELRARYGAPLLLFVGQLRYYKGLHFLVAAMAHLQANAHLLLVGRGPEEQRLRSQVQAAGLTDRIHFLGEMDNAQLPDIYAAADVFVLPSHLRSEAFGIVQIEAQVAGLPIVATELGTGTSYITQHGTTGFVVPPAQPEALARALDVLLANPALARHMGTAGRERAMREFGHARMIERIEQVYAAVSTGSVAPC